MRGRAAIAPRMGDVMARHRAVRTVMVGLGGVDPGDHRLDDLHREVGELRLDRIGAVMTGTPLDQVDFRAGDERQGFLGLGADVLHPLVAGGVKRDFAERTS